MICFRLNGTPVEGENGQTILDVAKQHSIDIPTLCYHQALKPYGACRICVVEMKKDSRTRLVPACDYQIEEGIEVQTDSKRVRKSRKMSIELLLSRCPDSDAIKKLAKEYSLDAPRFPRRNDKCILCGLCVRICKERMGVGTADFVGRGSDIKVDTPYHRGSDVCLTCGACVSVCPTGAVKLEEISTHRPVPQLSEFDMELRPRPSIYIPFPQALPNVPVIDRDNCVHFLTGGCKTCETFCPAGAIDYTQEDQVVELTAGAAILSPGYCQFDAGKKLELGYAWYPNVVTSLQFERLLSASGPHEGKILRPSDSLAPKRIAFIQCVGSRDKEHNYCSSVCCMYATKEAIIAMEHEQGLACHIFYMDMRAFGKGFDGYYEHAKELGVIYRRCRPSSVEQVKETGNLRIAYLDEHNRHAEDEFDLVVLSAGLRPNADVKELADKFGLRLSTDGFAETQTFDPVASSRPGIYICGPFSEPKDIPETVMEASSAAAKSMALLSEVRGELIVHKEWPPEKKIAGMPPRVGVFICHCGKNIGGVVNVPDVCEHIRGLPAVVHVENMLYTCSIDAQGKIKDVIREQNLNRVVVASCTPRTHEPLFRDTVREAGLNPYLFEMANIRDQCSWIHMHEPEKATRKAKELVSMAVAKARKLEPLYSMSVAVNSAALVIGGGVAGMRAALNLADQGFEVYLVERDEKLGGNLKHIFYMAGGENPQAQLSDMIAKVGAHPLIRVMTKTTIETIGGFVGNFETTLVHDNNRSTIQHGAIVVATGAVPHTPSEYLYGKDDRIVTQLELEQMLAASQFKKNKCVVMIQCVGSREGERMYCSRVCCTQAIKNALVIKETHPDTDVFILYREIRTYGFNEKYYTKARKAGVRFIRYDVNEKPSVSVSGDRLHVNVREPILGDLLDIGCDMVVLAPAIVPQEDAEELGKMLKVPLTAEKFFLEAHMKLRPVDFAVEGVFLAGMAHCPKTVGESITQAEAAASRAATIISKDKYETEATISTVNEDICSGCGTCVEVCEFDALELVETEYDETICRVNEAICKGCGCCAGACPSGAIEQKGFRRDQILAAISTATS
ncbi:MAG: FAD-dependent oxidoreductase [Chitinispirillaceae bacterium]|nr:FAD-dependent oxidoreductase [Chitinispirillaceae bacterium]